MKPDERTITWLATKDSLLPYEAHIDGELWQIRIGDFPAEPMYTLLIAGRETLTIDDWPAAWKKPAQTKYYLVNDRPVRFIPTAEGGMDIQALNMRTGNFERDMSYLTKVMEPFADVDSPTEAEFEARVSQIRTELAQD